MHYTEAATLLPEFPRTQHLPLEPNATSNDRIATLAEFRTFLDCPNVDITEKVDGANMRMMFWEGEPIIGNRSKILNKNWLGLVGQSSRKHRPAQEQYSPAWTWFYNHRDNFRELEKLLGFVPGVYGEWLFYRANTSYEVIPNWFITFDVWDPARGLFIPPGVARAALAKTGFETTPALYSGKVTSNLLLSLRDGESVYGGTKKEGIYAKTFDEVQVTGRYKMVAPWFVTDEDWDRKPGVKNKLKK